MIPSSTSTPGHERPIRVLVVEDSLTARELLIHILNSDPSIRVIGGVGSGEEAVRIAARDTPDLITMDVHMPGMDGFQTTRAIMETNPLPIVIVTASCDMRQLETSFEAIKAGALAVIQKPLGISHPDYKKQSTELIRKVKMMAEVKVVRRWSRARNTHAVSGHDAYPGDHVAQNPIHVVAIGASTGGPPVIQTILSHLPRDFSSIILIVQHMAAGFITGFAEWLGQTSALPVHVAFHGSVARPGHVYIAPDNVQMRIDRNDRLFCVADEPENGLRPSVSYLFRSVAEVFGRNAIGVLLTGMGKDGATELKQMKDRGAITIAQDAATSAVFGMPKQAVRLDATHYVLPADRISAVLASLLNTKVQQNGTG